MLPEAEPVAVVDRNLPNAETVGKEKKRARVGKNSRFPAPPLVPAPKFIYVRQETEEIFIPLCLPLPTLDNLIKAISDKYQVESSDIRHIYKRSYDGFFVHVDNNFVGRLAESFMLMKILVVNGTDPHQVSMMKHFNCLLDEQSKVVSVVHGKLFQAGVIFGCSLALLSSDKLVVHLFLETAILVIID